MRRTLSLGFLLVFMAAMLTWSCQQPVFEGQTAGDCSDGADNDMDGMFDCEDDACLGSPDCEGLGGGDDDDTLALGDDDTLPAGDDDSQGGGGGGYGDDDTAGGGGGGGSSLPMRNSPAGISTCSQNSPSQRSPASQTRGSGLESTGGQPSSGSSSPRDAARHECFDLTGTSPAFARPS